MSKKAYFPQGVFVPPRGSNQPLPRVYLSPQRYIQGEGTLDSIGRYLSLLKPARVALLISSGGRRRIGERLDAALGDAGIEPIYAVFNGECSLEEITAHTSALATQAPDCLLAIGGGKCVDAGKAIAWRLGIPVVVVPTLASNDAPCSALSVLYTPEGVSSGAEFYPDSPALVIVDTTSVAEADERYLVAGMGDAMATYFEARVCLENPRAVTTTGTRPTLAAAAIGEVCMRTLFAQGRAGAEAVRANRVDESLDAVVEANTLLSGIGFESGGLAGAHGVAQSYTAIPSVHAGYLHGEMVAMGTLVQLMLEARVEEANRVARFFAEVGLPVQLAQMGLAASNEQALTTLVDGTLEFGFLRNLTVDLSPTAIRQAIVDADTLGVTTTAAVGDEAYRRLHA